MGGASSKLRLEDEDVAFLASHTQMNRREIKMWFKQFLAIYGICGHNNNDASKSKLPSKKAREIFNRMDSNNDGVLSKREFVEGCLGDKHIYRLLVL